MLLESVNQWTHSTTHFDGVWKPFCWKAQVLGKIHPDVHREGMQKFKSCQKLLFFTFNFVQLAHVFEEHIVIKSNSNKTD